MEAWCSMQRPTKDGLRPATKGKERYTIACIHNASYEFAAKGLVAMIANQSSSDMHSILAAPDVNVTNMKDKERLLPKVKEMDSRVKLFFGPSAAAAPAVREVEACAPAEALEMPLAEPWKLFRSLSDVGREDLRSHRVEEGTATERRRTSISKPSKSNLSRTSAGMLTA